MGVVVNLPLWAVLILSVLAGWAVLDRLLIPSVRWMLRRRANRAIDELNTRLSLRIQPFKMTRRQVLTDNLLYDPEVLEAVEEHARQHNMPREVAMEQARKYAREIVPAFNAYAYFRIGTRLAKRLSTALYRVRLGFMDREALGKIDPDASVVFVMNHRSNMDYVLVTYMAASSSALSYAVGEWARIWLLQSLIRAMGAYFIRRDSRDDLYRRVLARYVHMATKAGVTQAMFPEGGLSRDGALRPPKLGLLSYMISGFDPHGSRDVIFIPVGLNYDRVLEDRVLTSRQAEAAGQRSEYRFRRNFVLRYLWRSLWLALRGRWYRYGYACVSFGTPISLRDYLSSREMDFRALEEGQRRSEIEAFGNHLMEAVGRVIPALPVSLVASAFLQNLEGQLSLFELKGEVFDLMRRVQATGAHVHIPRSDVEYAVEVGLRMLKLRQLVIEEDGLYRANAEETILLRYYANAIAHLTGLPIVAAEQTAEVIPPATGGSDR